MPQLVPFYFLNQIFWGYVVILTLILLLSYYVLPRMLSVYLARWYIVRLT